MEQTNNLLIVVDAGHGGWDNGASFEGRLEKDDNLRLALAVERELLERGAGVLMTRRTDEYISLTDRADLANQNNADLFVSLHRNSYIRQTPDSQGVENIIYLSAPEETTGRAARLVLDEVVAVGVQRDNGVTRGNYSVLRRTAMPAMLLEMGYIINERDNELFDEHLDEYAAAIARGILRYFGQEDTVPPPPAQGEHNIAAMQSILNERYGAGLEVDGLCGPLTRRALTAALQTELNRAYDAGLDVDGIYGPLTAAALRPIGRGERGPFALLVQMMLVCNRYDPGAMDGIFGSTTEQALIAFQRENALIADGIAGRDTIPMLLGVAD